MSIAKPDLKAEAIRLRVEQRMSLREIAVATGAARGSLSLWLQPYPLTDEEKRARSKMAKRYVTPKKSHGEESKFYRMVAWQTMSRQQKGKVAEAAVYFRLALHGFNIYSSFFDGDKADWLVEVPETGKILKLQVRCVYSNQHGLPGILLTCAEGHHKRRRYKPGEFDFIIGYYLYNDTAYIFSFDELINHRTMVTISEQHAERWDKLRY